MILLVFMYKGFEVKSIKWLFCVALAVCAGNVFAQEKDNRFEVSKNLDIFNAIVKELEMFYVDSLDINATVARGINSMLGGLDPYTEYYPEEKTEELKIMATGEYGGIGSVITQRDSMGVIVVEPYEGMPAALAGLKAGDIFLSIDGVDVTQKTSGEVSDLLKGVPNTKLKIKVRRPGEKKPKEFELTRQLVSVNPVTYYGVRNDSIGYIYLQTFNEKSIPEIKKALDDLKKNYPIKSLVLDLRGNGGGILEGAIQLVNMFVPKGEIVLTTKGKLKQSDRTYRTTTEPIDTVMPLAVLINSSSASASEITAGAIQDLDRGVLVGQRSYGKGLVQSPRDLPYNGSLKVTISKYYTPSGRCIQAIDYSHRNADGSVGRIPDSLTTVFKTANGRLVRDGGGITPDFEVKEPKSPTMLMYLYLDNIVFDYVTEWAQKHKTIPPMEEFVFPESDYEGFKEFVKKRNFTYDRQSERLLKELKKVAEIEGYMDEASEEYEALAAKFTPNLDRDLERFKKDIINMISSEIGKRYYYQRGDMIQALKDDEVLDKALEILSNPELYRKTLTTPAPIESNEPAEEAEKGE